jgi:hypothetical protein
MRKHDSRVTLRVRRTDGSWRDCGVFSKREGGVTAGEESKFFPGGGMPAETYVAPPIPENVTLTKMKRSTDIELQRWLRTRVSAEAEGHEQPLDPDGNAFGQGEVYRGKVLSAGPGEHEAGSAESAEIVVVISTAGTVG